jgi:hypothetical protein
MSFQVKSDLADVKAKLAKKEVKLEEAIEEIKAQKKKAEAATKDVKLLKKELQQTQGKLSFAERALKKKDEEIKRLQDEKDDATKAKERKVQILDAKCKAVMMKMIKTGEAAKTALELFEQGRGKKKEDRAWNPPEDEQKAQKIMDEVVAADYGLFPGDKDMTANDVLFGEQPDGSYVPPPQGPTFRNVILHEYPGSTIIVKGEVSSLSCTCLCFLVK